MTAANNSFDEQTVLRELKRFLPAMSSSGAFTYQNPLQAFQDQNFHDALRNASRIMGYRTTLPLEEYRSFYNAKIVKPEILEKVLIEKKGGISTFEWQDKVLMKKFPAEVPPRIGKLRENWKTKCKIALDEMVHPALFRILGSYLDQRSAAWKFPVHGQGFFDSMREMESDSLFSVFKTSRARNLLLHTSPSLTDLLTLVVGDEALFEQYLFDQQMAHRGWSGLVLETEEHDSDLPGKRSISLYDAILFELLLEIDALDYHLNEHWNPLSTMLTERPEALFTPVPVTEKSEVLAIWQETFEWSYYDQVIAALCNQQGLSQFSEQLPEAMPGYTSNSVYIVGGRALIRNPFAGRREFLNPYDFSADTDGEILVKFL